MKSAQGGEDELSRSAIFVATSSRQKMPWDHEGEYRHDDRGEMWSKGFSFDVCLFLYLCSIDGN